MKKKLGILTPFIRLKKAINWRSLSPVTLTKKRDCTFNLIKNANNSYWQEKNMSYHISRQVELDNEYHGPSMKKNLVYVLQLAKNS
ncbi:hypothetical protein H5410_027853 [Solanum commersonii]|uniref:Uncharacterized protein n=1 Tax=Solanum commersonii TaxID=4109 RepID=A0A9J5Z0C4_SOLCO|nr:hypothetical protein H5410_027853 [Solanum commersonii]